ncbi:MAG: protein kinase [Planctomycetales bacterium]|nr:protein kinase [Planctomycetales bacterium]
MKDRTETSESTTHQRIDCLIDQYLSELRQGNVMDVDAFAHQYPDVEQELREMLQTIVAVERLHAGAHREECPTTSTPHFELPMMDDYRILRVVGRGGMGIVFEAIQKSLDRRVALKVLPQSMLQNQQARERFQFEARTAARLHHTNIVPIHEFGFHEDTCFFTMQFIDGQALDQVIADLKRVRSGSAFPSSEHPTSFEDATGAPTISVISVTNQTNRYQRRSETGAGEQAAETSSVALAEATRDTTVGSPSQPSTWSSSPGYAPYFINVAQIARQAAEALAYAHQQGVIHRDIKPSNLILDQHWKLWITDFGLAKSDESMDLTRQGDVVGTLRYMAPERFEGECTSQNDIYSLGATLYELIVLHPPFHADDRIQLIDQIKAATPAKLRSIDRKVPYDLQTIVEKAMAADTGRRYLTAKAMANDLERFLAGRPILARRVGNMERLWLWSKKNRSLAAALTAVIAMLVLGTIGSTFAAIVFQRQSAFNAILAAQKAAQSVDAKTQRDLALQNAYFADMRQVLDDWENGHVRRMMTTLREYVPHPGSTDVRGWEWSYLLSLPNQNVSTITDFPGTATQVGWSPDGQKLAGVCSDDRLRIWDTNALLVREIVVPGLRSFAFDRDGKRLATACGDPVLRIWDLDAGRMIDSHKTEFTELHLVDWNHQTNQIALGGIHPDNQVLVVDAENHQIVISQFDWFHLEQLEGRTFNAPNLLKLSPDGKSLFVSFPKGFCVCDLHGAFLNRSMGFDRDSKATDFWSTQPMCVAWLPDSQRYVIGTYLQGALVCEIDRQSEDPQLITRIGGGSVDAALVSPDGQRVYLGNRSQRIEVFNLDEPESLLQTHKGHLGGVISLAIQPRGELLASSSNDGSIRIWNLLGNVLAQSTDKQLLGSGTSPDGRWNWTNEAGTVTIFDVNSGTRLFSLNGFAHGGRPLKVAAKFFPDIGLALFWESEIAFGPLHIQVVDTNCWQLLHQRSAYTIGGNWSSVAGDFAVDRVGETGGLWLFDGARGTTSFFQAHAAGAPNIALSPSGKYLASAWQGEVKLWDTRTQTEIASFYGHRPGGYMPWLCWGNTGRYFATTSIDRTVKIWDVERKSLTQTLLGLQSTSEQTDFGFSKDDRLFSARDNSNNKVWHVDTGRELLSVTNKDSALIRQHFANDNTSDQLVLSETELQFHALAKAEELSQNSAQVEQYEHQSQHALAAVLLGQPDSQHFAPERAMRLSQRALELNPTNPQYLLTLALAQYYSQAYADALATLKLSADSGADPLIVDLLQADCLRLLDRKQDATVAISRAKALFNRAPPINKTHRRLARSILKSFFTDGIERTSPTKVGVTTLQDELNGIDDGQISLREAAILVADGGEIHFDVAGVVRLKLGAVEIDKSLSLVGPGTDQLTIDAEGQSQIFRIRDGDEGAFAVVSISGIHLTKGASPQEKLALAGSYGGAIQCFESLNLRNCLFDHNDGGHAGGAVMLWDSGKIVIHGCQFISNSATVGGAIQIAGADPAEMQASVSLYACTFRANQAEWGGAAIRTGSGEDTLRVVNSTFVENIATQKVASADVLNGGGAVLANNRETEILHCTFTKNQGAAVTSHLYAQVWSMEGLPKLTISNSILAENLGVDGTPLDLNSDSKVIATVSHCILGEIANGFDDAGNNLRGFAPRLGPLANNGGPTPTVALLPGSPAIDSGSANNSADPTLRFDQRGAPYARSLDGNGDGKSLPDIGAVEFCVK